MTGETLFEIGLAYLVMIGVVGYLFGRLVLHLDDDDWDAGDYLLSAYIGLFWPLFLPLGVVVLLVVGAIKLVVGAIKLAKAVLP